jgi:hypothetical protein
MLAERQIISADILSRFVTLPKGFAHRQLEVFIYPLDDTEERQARGRHDTDIINAHADLINAQVAETLLFQDEPEGE